MLIKNEFKDTMKEYNTFKDLSDNLNEDTYTEEDFEIMDMSEEEIKEYKENENNTNKELEESLKELKELEENHEITEEDRQEIIKRSNIEYYIDELNKKRMDIEIDNKLSEYEKNKGIEKYNNKIADIKDSIYLYKLEGLLDYYIKPPKNIKKQAIDILRKTKKITISNDIKYIEENINKIIDNKDLEKNVKKFIKAFYHMITKKTLSEISLYIFFINYNISTYLNNTMYENNKVIFKESLYRIIKKI